MSNNEGNWGGQPPHDATASGQKPGLGDSWANQGRRTGAPGQQSFGSHQGHPIEANPGVVAPRVQPAQQHHQAPQGAQPWYKEPVGVPGGTPNYSAPSQFGAYASPVQPKPKGGPGRMMGWGVIASALLAIIGCFGTWIYVKMGTGLGNYNASSNGLGMESSNMSDRSSSGNDEKITDGWFVLIPALIALVLGALRVLGRLVKPAMWGAALMGLIATGIAAYDWNDVRSNLDDLKETLSSLGNDASFSAGTGWGLTLCLLAGIALIITSAISALRD